jgi:hypothetical protein
MIVIWPVQPALATARAMPRAMSSFAEKNPDIRVGRQDVSLVGQRVLTVLVRRASPPRLPTSTFGAEHIAGILGEFPKISTDSLIEPEWVEAAQKPQTAPSALLGVTGPESRGRPGPFGQ